MGILIGYYLQLEENFEVHLQICASQAGISLFFCSEDPAFPSAATLSASAYIMGEPDPIPNVRLRLAG